MLFALLCLSPENVSMVPSETCNSRESILQQIFTSHCIYFKTIYKQKVNLSFKITRLVVIVQVEAQGKVEIELAACVDKFAHL